MNGQINETKKREHKPGCTCSLCGNSYGNFVFKNGYVCETCLDYIKTQLVLDDPEDSPDSPDKDSL